MRHKEKFGKSNNYKTSFDNTPNDWVSKDGKNFYWDESINSAFDAKEKGLIYGGSDMETTIANFNDNLSFLDRYLFKKSPRFDNPSYLKAKATPKATKGIEITKRHYSDYKRKTGDNFIGDEKIWNTGFRFPREQNLSLSDLELKAGKDGWSDVIEINGRKMEATLYTPGGNFIDRIYFRHNVKPDNQSWLKITNGGGLKFKNTIIFTNEHKKEAGILYVTFKNNSDYLFTKNYIKGY